MGKYLIGWQLMVVGMGTVFLSLYLLSLILRLTGYFFRPDDLSPKVNELAKVTKKDGKEIDSAKIVAITTAIYQVLGQKEYHIISIKRDSNSTWKY